MHLGCPIWSHPPWVGRLFSADTRPSEFLAQYAQAFNAVEGNSTFYGLPSPPTVAQWRQQTPPGFAFCFKFPRAISHDGPLSQRHQELVTFLQRLSPLADRLGPLFLQLPPRFGPAQLDDLEAFLPQLPTGEFRFAVEVRHRAFFAKQAAERRLNRLLFERGIERVVLDSRALFAAAPMDDATRVAQGKKPRLPARVVALGKTPLVRYIGHPEIAANGPFLLPWRDKVAHWLTAGQRPYLFFHTPNNDRAPELVRFFYHLLMAVLPTLPPLPPWPAEQGGVQGSLF